MSEHTPPSDDATAAGHDALARRLTAWLAATLTGEEPLQGLDTALLAELAAEPGAEPGQAPPGCDQFALWSALTALTQEVRLQGRAFGRLGETLAPLATLEPAVSELIDANGKLLERTDEAFRREIREAAEQARLKTEREMLAPLLDTRERLARNLRSLDEALARPTAARKSRWAFFSHADEAAAPLIDAAAALREGNALSLARLEETLTGLGVQFIERTGVPFDPRLMQAVQVTPTAEAGEGTVLEIVRPGYAWRGELYRAAQVRVAKNL